VTNGIVRGVRFRTRFKFSGFLPKVKGPKNAPMVQRLGSHIHLYSTFLACACQRLLNILKPGSVNLSVGVCFCKKAGVVSLSSNMSILTIRLLTFSWVSSDSLL